MASANLGGLGPKEAATVFYDWAAPSWVPQFLPWVGILALLLLKPNRCALAWWIWAPLAATGWVIFLPESGEPWMELISALGFGLAAVWLVSGYLVCRHRTLAWLGIFAPQGLFGGLPYLFREGFEPQALGNQGCVFAVNAAVISVALSLAGKACRGRCGWLRTGLQLLAALVAVWLLLMAPFLVLGMIASREEFSAAQSVMQCLGGVVAMSGITFGALLPFLVLAFANGFYRERLKGLFRLGDASPPPVINPPRPAVPEASAS